MSLPAELDDLQSREPMSLSTCGNSQVRNVFHNTAQ